jgi:anti-sigma factor RsiW
MNDNDRDELMANYLGDELNESDRARFEAMMAEDADLAAEAAALRGTIDRMRALDTPGSAPAPGMADAPEPGHAPPKVGVASPSSMARPLRAWGSAVLRYAAVIGLAFVIGYVMGGRGSNEAGRRQAGPPAVSDAGPVPAPARRETDDWLQRVAEVYVNRPGGSSFARSLVAIAKAGEDGR